MASATVDRRHSERHACDVPVILRDPDVAESPDRAGRVENLSGDGFELRATTTVSTGDRIRLYPWDNGRGVPARVMWTRMLTTEAFLAGCRLENPADRVAFDERAALDRGRYTFWIVAVFVLALGSLLLALLTSTP